MSIRGVLIQNLLCAISATLLILIVLLTLVPQFRNGILESWFGVYRTDIYRYQFWSKEIINSEWDMLLDVRRALAAPSGRNVFVSILDCGGQLPFSAVQTLTFNTVDSIFLLVYDLSIPFDTVLNDVFRKGSQHFPVLSLGLTHGDCLILWLSTLSMSVDCSGEPMCRKPLVLLIGTHRAQADQTMLEESDKSAKRLVSNFANAPLRIVGPFHVDNSLPLDEDMVQMRHLVTNYIQQEATSRSYPVSFLKAEWQLRRRNTLLPHMSVEEFCQLRLLTEAAGVPKKQMADLLDSLHQLGVIRSFHHHHMPASKARVFTNTQWLLDQISKVLVLSMKTTDVTLPTSDRVHIDNYLRRMGILTAYACETLLWSDLSADVRANILQIMYDVGLQCPVTGDRFGIPEDAGPLYHIPMCIQEDATVTAQPRGEIAMPALLVHFSEKLLPHALYSRFAVHMLQHYRPPRPAIGFRSARFCCDIGSYCYFAEMHYLVQGVAIQLDCTNASVAAGEVKATPSLVTMATNLLCRVEEVIQKLRCTGSPGLKWYPAFECPQHQRKQIASPQSERKIDSFHCL